MIIGIDSCFRRNDEGINMKVAASIKQRCKECKIVKREGILYVICPRDSRHKQRQG